MPTITHYRATWFALLKQVETQRGSRLTPEERHDIQLAHAGKPSLMTWAPEDYDRAIAALQRAMGQHRDPHAHVREPVKVAQPSTAMREPGGSATAAQWTWIEDLCDRIAWKKGRVYGPPSYAGKVLFRDGRSRATLDQLVAAYQRASNRAERERAWRTINRRDASDFLQALQKLAQVNPAGTQ